MTKLTRDRTAEPVPLDQILRRERGQGNIHFPCSAGHEQDWQPYPVDAYSAIWGPLHYRALHGSLHGGPWRSAEAPWRPPWRFMEPPRTFTETPTEPPWTSTDLHGGFHGASTEPPWNSNPNPNANPNPNSKVAMECPIM